MARKAKYVEGKDFNLLLPFSIKEVGMGEGMEGSEGPEVIKIEGYANYSGDISVSDSCCYIDRANDVVVPAGMDITNYKKNPVILMNHDREYPIGKAIEVQKRPDGIFITAEIHAGAMDEEDFYAIKNGIVNSFSIGFRTKAGEFRTVNDQDVYFITKAELFETSVVTIPCNAESGFSVIKSFGDDGFSAIDINTTQPPTAVETKSTYGDDKMKLKRKELFSAEVIEQYKSLGLESELEGEVEVSTKSFIEMVVAKQFAELKSELVDLINDKFKSEEPAETPAEAPVEEEQPASEEEAPVEEEAKSEQDDVEDKNEDAETVKSLASMVEQLKALAE